VTASSAAGGVWGILTPGKRFEILPRRSLWVKLNRNRVAILFLAAFMAVPALAQSGGADTYKAKCALCHGADGQAGTPAGKMLKAASFKEPAIVKAPDAELIAIVKSGKNKMPSFAGKLADDQIKAAVAYIRTLQK
jgi:mono/diheme cytochrome c family protein